MESQNKNILKYLQGGNSLTPLEALKLFGCFRLGGRIYDLKKAGHPIKTQIIEVRTSLFETKRVAKYYL